MKIYSIIALGAACAATLASCSGDNHWQMTGQVHGADADTRLVVETSQNGRWYGVDTVTTDGAGRFQVSLQAPSRPGVYRLNLDGKYVYFPVDSLDRLTFTSTVKDFDTDFDLGGTTEAEMMKTIDKRLIAATASGGAAKVVADSLLKRELGRKILANPSGIVAYYIVNKRIEGRPLFNPTSSFDRRIIGAVANAYDENRPSDPRTAYLRKLYVSGRKASAATTIEAPEVPMFDIRLYDANGKEQSLAEAAKANKVVVLNFTTYSAEGGPVLNSVLNKVYQQYHGRGVQIYQVSVADDERLWLDTARNLPWISVYQPEAGDATPLLNYNVNMLPSTFVIANGEIRHRVIDPTKLDAVLDTVL